jgi:hypothetical protein
MAHQVRNAVCEVRDVSGHSVFAGGGKRQFVLALEVVEKTAPRHSRLGPNVIDGRCRGTFRADDVHRRVQEPGPGFVSHLVCHGPHTVCYLSYQPDGMESREKEARFGWPRDRGGLSSRGRGRHSVRRLAPGLTVVLKGEAPPMKPRLAADPVRQTWKHAKSRSWQ